MDLKNLSVALITGLFLMASPPTHSQELETIEDEFTVIEKDPSADEDEFEEIPEEDKAIINQDEAVEYSTQHDERVFKEYIIDQITNGGNYVYYLLRGDSSSIPKNTQDEWLKSIVAIMWYLFAEAVSKGEAFDEGTFVLQDPNFRIYDFFLHYLMAIDKAIPRRSSHFKQYYKFKKINFDQFGIDIDIPDTFLPVQKAHLLFGKVDEERELIFIKPENAGLEDFMSFIQHAWEFIHAQVRKKHDAFWSWMEISFGKEWLNDTFIETAKEVIGTDDDPNWRKERIPWFVLNNYIILLHQIPEDIADNAMKKEMIERATILGIQEIASSLSDFAMNIDDETLRTKIVNFLGQLNTAYDHINLRFGREVILTESDLKDTSQFYHKQIELGLDEVMQEKDKLEEKIERKRLAIIDAQERQNVPTFMRIRTL